METGHSNLLCTSIRIFLDSFCQVSSTRKENSTNLFLYRWLLNFPSAVQLLTKVVFRWELIGPLCLYSPIFPQYVRIQKELKLEGV